MKTSGVGVNVFSFLRMIVLVMVHVVTAIGDKLLIKLILHVLGCADWVKFMMAFAEVRTQILERSLTM